MFQIWISGMSYTLEAVFIAMVLLAVINVLGYLRAYANGDPLHKDDRIEAEHIGHSLPLMDPRNPNKEWPLFCWCLVFYAVAGFAGAVFWPITIPTTLIFAMAHAKRLRSIRTQNAIRELEMTPEQRDRQNQNDLFRSLGR